MTRGRAAMLLVAAACASTRPDAARRDVADLVASHGGPSDAIEAAQTEESRARVRERVADLLEKPLTVERALQIAVLNNRGLQATLEELGVAQADLVAAGLLDNPTIGGDLVISTRGNGLGGGLSLSQNLLSVFLIPARRRVAKARLQHSVLVVADATLELVRDVRVAYADVQAAVAMRDLHKTLTQAAEVADELAARQHEAGNLPDLDRELFAASLDHARLDLAEADLEVVAGREMLNRLLGLWGKQVQWKLASTLPEPADDGALDGLEQLGLRQRLDVSAARAEVEAMRYAIKLRRRGVIPGIEGGVEARNEVGEDEGHEWVLGPAMSVEIPIFDPGHADFARLRAQLRHAQYHLEQTAIVARSHIRLHREELVTARRRVTYLRETVLPRRETVGARAIERYNAMLIGAYELLEIRAEQVESRAEYVEALRDYWVARADLERSVGGQLPVLALGRTTR